MFPFNRFFPPLASLPQEELTRKVVHGNKGLSLLKVNAVMRRNDQSQNRNMILLLKETATRSAVELRSSAKKNRIAMP
jgi:hypothetical protein